MKHVCKPERPYRDDMMCDSCPTRAIVKCGEYYYCRKHWDKHRTAQALPLLTKKVTK